MRGGLILLANTLHLPPLGLSGGIVRDVVHLPPDGATENVAEVRRYATFSEKIPAWVKLDF